MPAGRPKHGESSLQPYAERCKNVLRPLLYEAIRRDISLSQLCGLLGVDIKVLKRYFESKKSATETVSRICKALGYKEIVAGALCDSLSDEDCREIEALELGEVAIRRASLWA